MADDYLEEAAKRMARQMEEYGAKLREQQEQAYKELLEQQQRLMEQMLGIHPPPQQPTKTGDNAPTGDKPAAPG